MCLRTLIAAALSLGLAGSALAAAAPIAPERAGVPSRRKI